MRDGEWNFEQAPWTEPPDETDIALRAYFDRVPDAKLGEYRSAWTDEQLIAWDGNFKDDGALLLPCTERDIDAAEYRRVLEQCIEYRRNHEQLQRTSADQRRREI